MQLGRTWSSYYDIRRSSANDNFDANVAASFNTWVGYNDRFSNSIKYISPEFAGFSGSLTYSFGEDKSATNSASNQVSLGLQYANGPLFVGFAHQTQKQRGAKGVFSAASSGALNGAVLALADFYGIDDDQLDTLLGSIQGKTTYNLINGSYDFGVAKIVGGYNQAKQTFLGEAGSLKANEWNLGVEVPLAANLSGGFGYASSKLKADGTEIAKTTGYTATLLYSLSKRTTVYGALSQTKLDGKSRFDDNKYKQTLYAVGLNHKF